MLKSEKLVAKTARHSFTSSTIELIFETWELKADGAYAESDNPRSACLSAPQSFTPSPHMPTLSPIFWYRDITFILSFGFDTANTFVLKSIYF